MCKKAPFQVLFCGIRQSFTPPGIDSLDLPLYFQTPVIT
ncbi:transcriptional regulator [Salmonella enterica subsp. enterica serovar Agona]|nr:transcriptional regulator [Salmonella enterica subsp. enterica serovar Agona]